MPLRATGRRPWLVLAVLAMLLGVLGFLQYRWTREIGQAAAERRQADLQRAARRFAGALDRELARVGIAFFADLGPPPADREAFLIERLEAFQERENAGLVSGLLLATRDARGRSVLAETRRGDDAFHETPWPEELRGLAERLSERSGQAPAGFPIRPGAVLEKPLGLVLPLFGGAEGRGPGPGRPRLSIDGFVVVELDEAYLRERLMPRLAEAHFGPAATRPFVAAILHRADRSVFYASEPDAVTGDKRSGDVELALPGRGRPAPEGRDFDAAARVPDTAGAPPPPPEDSPWLLVARHRGGSFEAAVAAVQRRNLVTGFGVLALLGATVLVLVAQAQRAHRLARQQIEFVTGVTHELNTPLAAIRSAGQNLAAGIVTDAVQVRRYGDLIEKEGGRLTGLVAQVLDFAGIESGSRAYAQEPLSLAVLVDEVLRDNRLVLEQSGIVLERKVAENLPQLRGDAPALRRVIANLVTNAAKFAASGKWIGVRAEVLGDGRAVQLQVEDRGPGIPREERERVFEPFYRGPAAERNDAPGSGLGLSLVRHVVRAHGGSVRVEDSETGGARLVVELPASRGERLVSGRILIVEDEPALVLTLGDRLRSEGYEVESAETGDLGARRAREGSFDLVLLDVALPGKNGFDVLRDLRQQRVATPVIMLTARGQVLDRVLGLKLGADDYLAKPFDMMELVARVEAVLRRKQASPSDAGSHSFGDVRVDFRRAEVQRGGTVVELSSLEFKLLRHFIEHRGALVTRRELLEHVWGYPGVLQTRTVDVHVASLRQKIERHPAKPEHIITVHRMGYRFVG